MRAFSFSCSAKISVMSLLIVTRFCTSSAIFSYPSFFIQCTAYLLTPLIIPFCTEFKFSILHSVSGLPCLNIPTVSTIFAILRYALPTACSRLSICFLSGSVAFCTLTSAERFKSSIWAFKGSTASLTASAVDFFKSAICFCSFSFSVDNSRIRLLSANVSSSKSAYLSFNSSYAPFSTS